MFPILTYLNQCPVLVSYRKQPHSLSRKIAESEFANQLKAIILDFLHDQNSKNIHIDKTYDRGSYKEEYIKYAIFSQTIYRTKLITSDICLNFI